MVRNRGAVWERLTRLGVGRKGPWMMTGDFNELVDPVEKLGEITRKESSCLAFKQMLLDCGMWEIKHEGHQFYWYGHRNKELVQCRLDRTVANPEWSVIFGQAKATYLQWISSDHSPLLTNLMEGLTKSRASFKYDHRLYLKEGFSTEITSAWNHQKAKDSGDMMHRITESRKAISRWKRQNKSNSSIRI